jgi:DNA mismatch endonuclease (patch repair protein)
LFGHPDLVFPSSHLAVFVDGDYWHGNAWRVRGLATFESQFERINNGTFWRGKIERNMARDHEVNQALHQARWRVYRVFESRLLAEPDAVANEIERLVRERM